jgi:hypothetical protein
MVKMKSIWKYTLEAKVKQSIGMPLGSKILSAENQGGNIVVYALVDTEEVTGYIKDSYEILVYGTGHEVTNDISNYTFLDTVKMDNGLMMFHVFYK